MITFEKLCWEKGWQHVAGVDEAGRGPLAGPVMAAAVVFERAFLEAELQRRLAGLTDSKQLTERQRLFFYDLLQTLPEVKIGVGAASVEEIDRENIRRATHLAMQRALLNLPALPDHALIDGLPVENAPCPFTAIVRGDSLSISIAAASVIAKVTRDKLMQNLDAEFPAYGFREHKGYGTTAHIQALLRHGPTLHHRRSFRPVREIAAIYQGAKDANLPATHPQAPGQGRQDDIRPPLFGFVG